MRKFIIQVCVTDESMQLHGSADHVMTINAIDCLSALQTAHKAYPNAICFDAYIGRGEFRHVGTFGTELPEQWGAFAAGITS